MKRVNTRENKKNILTISLIFVFFPPAIIEQLSDSLNEAQRFLQIVCLIAIAVVLINRKIIRLSLPNLMWILYCLFGTVVTAIYDISFVYLFFSRVAVPITLSVLLCVYFKNKAGGMERLLDCMTVYWVILLVINTISLFVFPQGITFGQFGSSIERANWILGSKNTVTMPLIFCMIFFLYRFLHNKQTRGLKIRDIISLVFVFSLVFFNMMWTGGDGFETMGGSTTGMVVLVALFLLFIFRNSLTKLKIFEWLTVRNITILFVLVSILSIWAALNSSSWLGSIFTTVGKDSTASARTYVWKDAVSRLNESIWIGHGYVRVRLWNKFNSCYNIFLESIFRYGIVGLVLLISTFFTYNRKYDVNDEMRLFKIGVISLFICGLVNSISFEYLIIMLEAYTFFYKKNNNEEMIS